MVEIEPWNDDADWVVAACNDVWGEFGMSFDSSAGVGGGMMVRSKQRKKCCKKIR